MGIGLDYISKYVISKEMLYDLIKEIGMYSPELYTDEDDVVAMFSPELYEHLYNEKYDDSFKQNSKSLVPCTCILELIPPDDNSSYGWYDQEWEEIKAYDPKTQLITIVTSDIVAFLRPFYKALLEKYGGILFDDLDGKHTSVDTCCYFNRG